MRTKIISLSSGKGGVGKSVLSSSIAIELATTGKKTLIIDLDLGSPNIHSLIPLKNKDRNLSMFLEDKFKFKDIILETAVRNLDIVSGFSPSKINSSININKILEIFYSISNLSYDFIIFDLGAGSHDFILDFVHYSDIKILVTCPEVTAIENLHSFVRNLSVKNLKLYTQGLEKDSEIIRLIDSLPDSYTPSKIISLVSEKYYSQSLELKELFNKDKLYIVTNKAYTQKEYKTGEDIANLYSNYLGVPAKALETLPDDYSIRKALELRSPVITSFYNCNYSTGVKMLVSKILVELRKMKIEDNKSIIRQLPS